MADQADSRSVKVQIYGESYAIRTSDDARRIKSLADDVDRRMREIAQATSTVDSLKVAILAALHIAEELHEARQALSAYDQELVERSERCAAELDLVLRRPSEGE
jgi:cell division protein ZapA